MLCSRLTSRARCVDSRYAQKRDVPWHASLEMNEMNVGRSGGVACSGPMLELTRLPAPATSQRQSTDHATFLGHIVARKLM